MTVPAVPGAGLVMIEAEFVLRSFETFLDPPTRALDPHQRLEQRPLRAPGGEIEEPLVYVLNL